MFKPKRPFSEIEDETKLNSWSAKNPYGPQDIGISSGKKIWFDCHICDHDFQTTPDSINRGTWCPYCSGRKLCDDSKTCIICLPRTFYSFEETAKVGAWSDKNENHPWTIFKYSNKKVTFRCDTCDHEFQASPSMVAGINKSWCPFCANIKICENALDCTFCLSKTFFGSASQDKIDSWSEKNTFKPWEIFSSIAKKAWFDCKVCGHDFECILNHVSTKGRWCPYCANRMMCADPRECEKCLAKTFFGMSDQEKVSSWSKKNTFKPWEVFLSNHKAWFDCKKCGHDFESTLCDVATRGGWCPYCVSKRLCPDPRECEKCLPKTFYGASDSNKVNSWSEKNKLKSWEMFASSSKKVWFHCNDCLEDFECQLDHVIRGNWCPMCATKRNKAMSVLIGILDKLTIEHVVEETIKLGNRSLHWDVSCSFEDTEFFIESDGPHHFSAHGVTQVSRGKVTGDKATDAFQDQRDRDLLKETYINVNNGILFRFSYRQTSQIESLVSKMLEVVKSGKTGVFYMDDIYW